MSAFEELVNDAKTRVREIDTAGVKSRMDAGDPLVLLDVREDHEFAGGYARGALHVGKGVIERDIEKTAARDAFIVLYCGGGFRSALAADSLQKMGYTSVFSLEGGWKAWQKAGMPVVRPASSVAPPKEGGLWP